MEISKTAKCEEVVRETANMLLVGDRVRLFEAPYGWGTVIRVTDKTIKIVRPYIHTSDFTICAGQGDIGERLIDYMGQEKVRLERQSDRVYDVVFRTTVPK